MDCRWVILDNNENIIATRKVRHVGGSPTSTTHLTESFPQYLTIFVNNCDVAIATDFNPGTCTIRSLRNIMFLAIQNCGLSLEEAFLGVTYNAAKSLSKEKEIGLIKENYKADMIFWDIDSIDEIPYWFDSFDTKIFKLIKNGIEYINDEN